MALRELFGLHGSCVAGGQVSVDGCSGDAQCFGDLSGTFPVGVSGSGSGEDIGAHDGGSAAGAALGSGCGEAGHGAFADHVTFEFGERCHHDKEEFPFSARAVGSGQGSGENAQANSLLVESIGDGEYFLHRSAETVQFPDAQSVRGSEVVECFYESWTGGGAAGYFVLEDPAAAGSFKSIALELGVLSGGGDAGIADEIEMLGFHESTVAQPSHNTEVLGLGCETGCERFLIGVPLDPQVVSEPAVFGHRGSFISWYFACQQVCCRGGFRFYRSVRPILWSSRQGERFPAGGPMERRQVAGSPWVSNFIYPAPFGELIGSLSAVARVSGT